MTRTQIQLPEPLFRRLKKIAEARDWSLAELIRRGMEAYVQSCPEGAESDPDWVMPVLRGSGGHLRDPASFSPEVEAVERRFQPGDHWDNLRAMLAVGATGGNLTTDAHIAALASEYGLVIYSNDTDFGRFPNIKVVNPL